MRRRSDGWKRELANSTDEQLPTEEGLEKEREWQWEEKTKKRQCTHTMFYKTRGYVNFVK
jgi:hypothetical protein